MKKDIEDAAAIGIIGGADGPTAIVMSGPAVKLPFKARIRKRIYQYRRHRAEKKITAGTHSLPEVADYTMKHYHAEEASQINHSFIAQKKVLKEYLLFRSKETRPNMDDAETDFPMDFHVYEIRIDDSLLEVAIDYLHESFGVSYSGRKKAIKRFQKIAKDLYVYYGVSEADIQNKTQRYLSLLGILSR